MGAFVLAGTRKGLFLLESDEGRDRWELSGPFLTGWSIFHAVVDPRDGTIYAATNSDVYGATVHRSPDRGESWTRAEELGLPEDTGLTLEKTWHVEPGRPGEDGRLWLGAAPGVLFRTDDGGDSWQAVDGIVRHETRDRWNPGAGGMCCHSIALDPDEPERMYVGISAAGVFRSDDGGETFAPANRGTAAEFLPDPFPDLGQCVHKVLVHPSRPERLWQQNHCGVYRSDDRGESLGAAREQRASERFWLPAGPRPPGSGHCVRRPGGELREPRDAERAPRRLPDAEQGRVLGSPQRGAAATCLGRGDAGRVLLRPPGPARHLPRDAERIALRLPGCRGDVA